MSSLPVDVNILLQGLFIPDEGDPVIYPQVTDAAVRLGEMRVVCCRLLHTLRDTPYNVSNAAQLGGHQTLRNSAISETYLQVMLELVRVACRQLLQVLELPYNISKAATIGEDHVFEISGIYPQFSLTATQLEFVWDTYYQLLHVNDSLHDGSNATQFGVHQVLPDSYSGISDI